MAFVEFIEMSMLHRTRGENATKSWYSPIYIQFCLGVPLSIRCSASSTDPAYSDTGELIHTDRRAFLCV